MLIEAAVAAALYNDSPAAGKAKASFGAPESCALPSFDARHKLIVVRLSGGESVSTVAVGGLDRATETGEIRIGAGTAKLNVVVEATDDMVVRFSGRVSRLSKVVVMSPTGGGVTGVPAEKIHFRIGEQCELPHDAQQLQKALVKRPDIIWEPGDLYRGWTDGQTVRHEGVARSTDRGPRTYLEEQLDWLHPGGVMSIDPSTVVSSGEALAYSVLPYAAGAVQLERQGVLVPFTPSEIEAWKALARIRQGERSIENFSYLGTPYRVTRPTRVPVGLCGGHGLTFVVPSRNYLSGDPCHSAILALDGRILAPSWYADDPDCGSTQFTAFAQPHAPGPLRLREVNCAIVKTSRPYEYVAEASPNAKHMGLFPNNWKRLPLRIQTIVKDSSPAREYPVSTTQYSGLGLPPVRPAYRWSDESNGVWVAKPVSDTETGRQPLRPIFVDVEGSIREYPALPHPAGVAEGWLWVGGHGRAIASFRPTAVDDPITKKIISPTYGMVDVPTGRVLDDFGAAEYSRLGASDTRLKESFYPNKVVAAQRDGGRLQALMDFGPWVVWTQGEEPRVSGALPEASDAAISTDGKTVLMLRPNLPGEDNRAWFITCDGGEGGRHGPCPKREPKEGTWASLHDVETGRLLWRLRWTFDRYDRLGSFSLSPNGRIALMTLLTRSDPSKALIAVVSMSDGKIVQTLTPPRSDYFMGFAENGNAVWIISWRGLTLYDVGQ